MPPANFASSDPVVAFVERLLDDGKAPLEVMARSLSELVGGTCVVLADTGRGAHRPVGHATPDASARPSLDALLVAAAVPSDQVAALLAADGNLDEDQLPALLRPWCREHPPTRSVGLPLEAGGRRLGAVWLDDVDGSSLDIARALVAVGVLHHLADAETTSNADWAIRAETEMAARTEALETSNQAIDRLGSFVGHELRDSLRGLLGWSRLASASDLADGVRQEMLRKIVHATEEAAAVVGDLLEDVEQIQAGRRDVVPVDLNGVVGWVRDVLADRMERQRARIVVESLPTVECNPTALRRALLELVRNSLEHGGKFVEVHVTAALADSHVEVHVDDNGPGIDTDARERVFQPGYGTGVGSGYGLTNVRESLARIGGRAWVAENQVGGVSARIAVPRPRHAGDRVSVDA